MDDSNKSKLFTFGKLRSPADSDSEESLSDSTDEETVSKHQDKDVSTKANETLQELVKETEKLNFKEDFRPKVPVQSSNASIASFDLSKRRNFDGSNSSTVQPRSKYENYLERRNFCGQSQRLRGNWSFRCDDQEKNSEGLTESDITWASVKELHEKEAEVFTIRPYICSNIEGFTNINIYTPDFRDEEFILKVANLLREHVYFPYVMYYYANSCCCYMHTPNGEFYKNGENNCWVFLDKE